MKYRSDVDLGGDLKHMFGCLSILAVMLAFAFIVGVIGSWATNLILEIAHADWRVEWYHFSIIYFIFRLLFGR